MDQLQRIYRRVKQNIENKNDCDRDIFIVLNPGAADSDSSQCGHHLITILAKVQKSANLKKRDDFPNLVLLQYLNDIPIKATNIVYWNSKVFNEKLTDKMESIHKLFDDPSVLNPFEFVDGALSNRYGPEQQWFVLDSILKNHDENHESREHSVQQVVQMGSKVFSQFQNFIIVVLLSKYCDGCLLSILNHMTSLTLVKKFVWNLGRGVWSPKTRKKMDLCFSWVGDDEKMYKPSCWRYSNAEESSGSTPPSASKVATSSSKTTPVLPESDSHISKSNRNDVLPKSNDYFGALSSSTSSHEDSNEVYRENKVQKKNAQRTRRLDPYSDESDSSMSYRQPEKTKKTNRYPRENPLKRRSIACSSSDESDVRPISIGEKRKFVPKHVQQVVRKPSNKEMHDAFIQISQCFNDAQTVNLPLTREPSDVFCAFCFSFNSNSNHFCSALSDAEKMANKKVNEIMRNVKKLDRSKFEEIRMFLLDETNIWKKVSLSGRMAKRTGKPEKYYNSSDEKSEKIDKKAVHRSKRKRTNSRRPKRQQSDSEDSDMSSPIKKNFASSKSSLAFRSTSESNKTRYSNTGRPLRKVREAPGPPTNEVSQKDRKKEEICPDGDCFETVDFQKKYFIKRAVECGFRYPNDDYVPPPADRSTWSREDYRTEQFGPVYASARDFRPDYLNKRGDRLVKIQQFDWESDSGNCAEKSVPEKRSSQMMKRKESTPTTSSKNHLQEAVTETHNFLPPLKRSDVEFIDCENSIDGEEYQEEGPSTTSHENPTYYPEFLVNIPVATIPPNYITLSDDDEDEMNNNVTSSVKSTKLNDSRKAQDLDIITLGDSSDDEAPRRFHGMDSSQLGFNEYQGCIQQ